MANLLGRHGVRPAHFKAHVEPEERLPLRLGQLALLAHHTRLVALAHAGDALEVELEELESVTARIPALAMLATAEDLRREACEALAADASSSLRPAEVLRQGLYVCHRLARSLATGDAQTASRGFFDALDRPPVVHWIALLEQFDPSRRMDASRAIIAWIPGELAERARAGCRACSTGTLVPLEEIEPEIERRLRALEAQAAAER